MRPPARLDAWAITLSLSIIAGTIAPPLATALVLASLVVCAGSLFWKGLVPPDWRPMAVLLPLFVAAGAGIAFVHATTPDPLADLAAVEPGEVIITGKIASPPTRVSYGYMADVRVDHLWYDGKEILRGGGVEVFAGDLNLGVGDRVRVEGEISPPDSGGGFDYGRYLATKRISALVNATYVRPIGGGEGWIGEIHRRTDAALGYGLRPDEAAIVRGMVLGDRSLIPEELDMAFQRSGITHVLAISGQHVAVLAAMIYFLLRALAVPVMVRSPVTLALIWLYIIVAGAPPSALRAGVVATFVLAAPIFNRQLSPVWCHD
ncbi:MAG: ComEC family competence protein [Rubrobacteraceae bacterium]